MLKSVAFSFDLSVLILDNVQFTKTEKIILEQASVRTGPGNSSLRHVISTQDGL